MTPKGHVYIPKSTVNSFLFVEAEVVSDEANPKRQIVQKRSVPLI